jgi:predicted ATPase
MKIVVTGGPGGGKTTALDLFKREFNQKINVVPEAATAVFESGISRKDETPEVLKAIQKMIVDYQKNAERIYEVQSTEKILLCDRGTLDGLAYWPNSEKSFFEAIDSSFATELSRYDAVIFFETAAQANECITSNNPYRNESNEKAIELDKKLERIWSKHPRFFKVKSESSFMKKITNGIDLLKIVIGE